MSVYTIMHFSLMGCAAALFVSAMMTARRKKGKGWLRTHRALALTGVVSALAALASMAFLKFSMNYPHFASPHAVGGLAAMFAILVTPIFGNLTAAGRSGLRTVHRTMGRITVVLVIVVAVFGVLRMLQIMKVL